ncbi:MAG: transcriptional regulator of arginine metabolism [Myxococcota bacterium]|jgi:transcriptional regulator of arginine metabolism
MQTGMSRTDAIRVMLNSQRLTTQAEIVEALSLSGHTINQATVSRELRKLGVEKVDGAYRLPRPRAGAPIHRFTLTAGGCLAVIQTQPAFASVLAQRIDRGGLDGVLGTIAGDDTVFIALRAPEVEADLRELLDLEET